MKFEKEKLTFNKNEIQALKTTSEIISNFLELINSKKIEALYIKSCDEVYCEEKDINEFITYYLQELADGDVKFFSTMDKFIEYAEENDLSY